MKKNFINSDKSKGCYLGVTLFLMSFPLFNAQAQGIFSDIKYAVESRAVYSDQSEYSPMWLSANHHGIASVKGSNGYIRAGIFKDSKADSTHHWQHAYGIDLVTGWNHTSSFIVQQAYYDLSYRWGQLSIGSKERLSELKHPTLSSGGLTFGPNARPIPQIRLEIPEYIAFPWTKEWLHVKLHASFGLFTDNKWQKDFILPGQRYTQDVLYHSKSIFFKIGNKQKAPLVFEIGLEMATQFGGKAYNVSYGRGEIHKGDITMGSGIKDFWYAFLPFGSGGDPTDGQGYANVSGNMLGSLHSSFTYHFDTWKIRAYNEHFFEDHSMMIDEFAWKEFIDNFGSGGIKNYIPPIIPGAYYWRDGLYGIEITLPKNNWVSEVLYEYIGTKEQSGPIYHDDTPQISDQVSGRDNYYNHNIYTGWQHWGMSMGTPFMVSPIYNEKHQLMFQNNRAIIHHIGISGNPIEGLSYRLLFSHAKYWGTYQTPLIDTCEKTSALIEANYAPARWSGWQVNVAFAFDCGDLPRSTTGFSIGVKKSGLLNNFLEN